MNEAEIRRLALELAVRTCGESSGLHVVTTAKEFEAYLRGEPSK